MIMIAVVLKFPPSEIGELTVDEFHFWADTAREYARLSTANSI